MENTGTMAKTGIRRVTEPAVRRMTEPVVRDVSESVRRNVTESDGQNMTEEDVLRMLEPMVRSFQELRTDGGEISDYCRRTGEPVILTEEGAEDLVVLSREAYEKLEVDRIYGILRDSEDQVREGRTMSVEESFQRVKAEMEKWNVIM